jgi:hypothetical protein
MVGSNPSMAGALGMVGSTPAPSGVPPGGFVGGAFMGGTPGTVPPGFGGVMGMSGYTGFGGMCGHIGFFGMSGCCGGFPCHCFNNCPTTFGGCFGGCFGGFGGLPTQTYSRWAASPTKAFYFRHMHVTNVSGSDSVFEVVLVHYPERPKHFYYYDPAAKVYVGRYVVGAKSDACFSLLGPSDRKAELKSIREAAFRSAGPMPSLAKLILPKTPAFTSAVAAVQNVALTRPPEGIPDALLGLPAEEELGKKSK